MKSKSRIRLPSCGAVSRTSGRGSYDNDDLRGWRTGHQQADRSDQGDHAKDGFHSKVIKAYRRELPVQTALNPASLPNWAAGRAVDRTLGPFIDSLNRPVWVDLFRIEHQVNVVRSHGASPILSLPVTGTNKPGSKVNLGPGSLWFAAPLLANSAPSGEMCHCGSRHLPDVSRHPAGACSSSRPLNIP